MRSWLIILAGAFGGTLLLVAILALMFALGIGPASELVVFLPKLNAETFESIMMSVGWHQWLLEQIALAPVVVVLSTWAAVKSGVEPSVGRSLVVAAPFVLIVRMGLANSATLLLVYSVLALVVHSILWKAGLRRRA